tara:strand:+ start:5129 stop:5707 length:579 start_codon:yes stop_codon:yes gene_type:complete
MKREVTVMFKTDTEHGVHWDAREEFGEGPGHSSCGEYIGEEVERLLAAGREPQARRMMEHLKAWKGMNNGSQWTSRWTREDLQASLDACHAIIVLLDEEKRRLHEACDGTPATQQLYDWLGGRINTLKRNTNEVVIPLLCDAILLTGGEPITEVSAPTGVDAMALLEELLPKTAHREEHEFVPVVNLEGEER